MTVWSCLRGYLDWFWQILWSVKGLFGAYFYGMLRGCLGPLFMACLGPVL